MKRFAQGFAAMAIVAGATQVAPVEAQSAPTLGCDPGFYQVIAGQFASFQPGTGEYTQMGPDYSNYNAMGYRIADGYAYAIAGNKLLRIDGEGTRTEVGTLNIPKGSYTGDFGDDGLLHVSRGGRDWHAIDVDNLTATKLPGLSYHVKVADVANVNGLFYGVSNKGMLYSFDPGPSQLITEIGYVSGLPADPKAYGAAWATAGGNLYIGRNSGEIYQVTGYTTTSPVATQVATAPATNSNDGTSCSLAATPPGLNDVDGPTPESTPSTPAAQAAADEYEANYAAYEATFTEFDDSAPADSGSSDPEPTEEVTVTSETPTESETVTVADAGIGQGAACDPTVDVDRLNRSALAAIAPVAEETVLYSSTFDGTTIESGWQLLSGNWNMENGAFNQLNACGFDYTSLLTSHIVDNFRVEATFSAISGMNHGGIVINQASPYTRSGATVIDLFDDGTEVRWGYYDELGYHKYVGSNELVAAPKPGENVTLKVEVHGQNATIWLNDSWIADITIAEVGGMVGLVATRTDIAFDSFTLTALPPATS